jgi:hypothetical protein
MRQVTRRSVTRRSSTLRERTDVKSVCEEPSVQRPPVCSPGIGERFKLLTWCYRSATTGTASAAGVEANKKE